MGVGCPLIAVGLSARTEHLVLIVECSGGIVTKNEVGSEGVSCRVSLNPTSLCYRRHRFPPEIIQHAIWLYLRFTLSYRDVEELLA